MLEFASGLLGGCAGVLVGHPLDTIKVKLQTQDFRNPKYRGTWDCFQKIARKDGIKGLYRGMASPMVGVGGVNAITFGVQNAVVQKFQNKNSLTAHLASGVCAGTVQSFITCPVELTKTRLQIQSEMGGPIKYKGAFDCFNKIFRTEGIRGLFKGQLITVMREAPGFGTYFLTFEMFARGISGTPDSTTASGFAVFMAGGMAGMASWLITYPIDVIKSRLQSDGAFGPARYTSMIDCLKTSVKEEGFGVLARGLNSTLIRAFPTNAAIFFVVSNVLKVFNNETSIEESCNNVSELLHIGDMIIKTGEIVHDVKYFQNLALKNLKENHPSNFLPIVLAASKESINHIVDFFDILLHFHAEGLDDDTYYKSLTAFISGSQEKASPPSRSFVRRGIVTQVEEYSKTAMINHQIISSVFECGDYSLR